jgi:hypothetical protein
VFADAAARTTALTSVLAEGMVSYLQDTNAVEVYNGSAWVGVSGAGDVTEVQAGTGISVASGTGPIPVVTNTMATAVDAKGDLIVGTGADTFARLAVGTNGHTLVADSVEATGLKWAAPAGGSPNSDSAEVTTGQTTTSTSYTDLATSGPAVTVTTGTKALVIITSQIQPLAIDQTGFMSYAVSGATTIAAADKFSMLLRSSGTNAMNIFRASSAFMIENLTAGSNTFTAKYRVVAGTTEYNFRQITVIDMGS